jgi:hypothetical protein
MLITKDWINEHKTKNGAWTKKQIESLGLVWPPSKGWPKSLVGTEITAEAAERFESGSTSYAKKTNVSNIKAKMGKLTHSELMNIKTHLLHLLRKSTAEATKSKTHSDEKS